VKDILMQNTQINILFFLLNILLLDNYTSQVFAQEVSVPIDITEITNIETHFAQNNISVLYFTPLRGHDISFISKICEKSKIITFTGVTDFINDNDISVGFELQNRKMQISINLEFAIAEGANFSSRLLSVSQIK
jgi:hypothetical protein